MARPDRAPIADPAPGSFERRHQEISLRPHRYRRAHDALPRRGNHPLDAQRLDRRIPRRARHQLRARDCLRPGHRAERARDPFRREARRPDSLRQRRAARRDRPHRARRARAQGAQASPTEGPQGSSQMKKQEQQPAPTRATAAQIVASLGVTRQAVQLRAAKEHWFYTAETGRGGQRRLYEIAQLPGDVQIALAPVLLQQSTRGGVSIPFLPRDPSEACATNLTATPPRSTAHAELATLAAIYEAKPQREKDEASARMEIVSGFLHLRTSGVGRAAALGTISGARRGSIATIARYLAILEGKPEHTWLYLLTPRYRGREA